MALAELDHRQPDQPPTVPPRSVNYEISMTTWQRIKAFVTAPFRLRPRENYRDQQIARTGGKVAFVEDASKIADSQVGHLNH